MLDLGFVGLMTAWSAGVGLWALQRLRSLPEHPADALALAVPLGLGFLALATLGLAELGILDRTGLAALFVIGAAVGSRDAWRGAARLARRPSFAGLPLLSPDLF